MGKDISFTGRIIAALQPCSELTQWFQQIDIVGPYVVLRHIDDCAIERCLTMVICAVFRYITRKLRHFDFARQSAFECRIQNFPERNLETVHHTRNRPRTIVCAEMDQFAVNEFFVLDIRTTRIQIRGLLIRF